MKKILIPAVAITFLIIVFALFQSSTSGKKGERVNSDSDLIEQENAESEFRIVEESEKNHINHTAEISEKQTTKPDSIVPVETINHLYSIEGYVRDEAGSPVGEAKVQVRAMQHANPLNVVAGSLTDEEGYYFLQLSHPGSMSVFYEKRGYRGSYESLGFGDKPPAMDWIDFAHHHVQDVTLLGTKGIIEARVTDADTGDPVEDAQVSIMHETGFIDRTTDESGSFEFEWYLWMRGKVLIQKPGYEFQNLDIEEPTGEIISIKMSKGGYSISGHVYENESDEVVPNAFFMIYSQDQFFTTDSANSDGFYEISGLKDDEYTISVMRFQDSIVADANADISIKGKSVEKDFFLNPPLDVFGTVVRKDGETPVVGAEISIWDQGQARMLSPVIVVSDSAGQFRFDDIAIGKRREILIKAEKEDIGFASKIVSVNRDDMTLKPVMLELDEQAKLYGTVFDPDGKPVPELEIRNANHMESMYFQSFITDENGDYEVLLNEPMENAHLLLKTTSNEDGVGIVKEVWPAGVQQFKLDIHLIGGYPLAVTVMKGDQEPVKKATLSLMDKSTGDMILYKSETDDNGTAFFEHLIPATYNASLNYLTEDYDQKYISFSKPINFESVERPESVVLFIEDGVMELRGTVVNEDGSPIVGAIIKLHNSTSVAQDGEEYVSDELGEFAIPFTEYTRISIKHPEYGYYQDYLNISDAIDGVLEREFLLLEPIVLSGRITSHAPLEQNMKIDLIVETVNKKSESYSYRLKDFGMHQLSGDNFEVELERNIYSSEDVDGRKSFKPLRVKAEHSDLGIGHSQWITPSHGLTDGFDIELTTEEITIQILDQETEEPVRDVLILFKEYLHIGSLSSIDLKYRTDRDGKATIPFLKSSTDILQLSHHDYGRKIVPFGDDTEPVYFLEKGITLRGRILRPDGSLLTGWHFSGIQEAESFYSGYAQENEYELKNLKPGLIDLHVSSSRLHIADEPGVFVNGNLIYHGLELTEEPEQKFDFLIPELVPTDINFVDPLFAGGLKPVSGRGFGSQFQEQSDSTRVFRFNLPAGTYEKYHRTQENSGGNMTEQPTGEILTISPGQINRLTFQEISGK